MRRCVLAAIAVSLFLALGIPAQANVPTTYFHVIVQPPDNDLTFFLDEDMGWTDGQIVAIEAAMTAINSVLNNNVATLQLGSAPHDWEGCTGNSYSIIEKVGDEFLPGASADTQVCPLPSNDDIKKAHIRIETPQNLYWGPANPEPDPYVGARGILVHELIHALGFGIDSDGVVPDHFLTPGTRCDQSRPSNEWHTMCQGQWFNGSNVPQENRKISLEVDDIWYIQDAYA